MFGGVVPPDLKAHRVTPDPNSDSDHVVYEDMELKEIL
jgi:hypothetical protein